MTAAAVAPTMREEITAAKRVLRSISRLAEEHGELSGEDAWGDAAGEAWRLHADADDLTDALAAGDLTDDGLAPWLMEVEELANHVAGLPRFENE